MSVAPWIPKYKSDRWGILIRLSLVPFIFGVGVVLHNRTIAKLHGENARSMSKAHRQRMRYEEW